MHIQGRINGNSLSFTQMLDLFTIVRDEPELPIVEVVAPVPAIVEAIQAQQCTFIPKTYMKPSEALPIYNAVVDHLSTTNVPPFSTFYLKSATPRLLKWCMESPPKPQDQSSTPPDQLVLYMLVERQSQDPANKDTVYHEWERIYSRSVNSSKPPLGLFSKPRKERKARGSRHSNREMLVD